MAAGKMLLGGACAILGTALAGCGQGASTKPGDGPTPTVAVQPAGEPRFGGAPAAGDSRYAQSFEQAAVIDEIPEGQQLPPDRTMTGKPTGPLRLAVEQMWPKIALVDGSGNVRAFTATVETAAGSFEIALNPESAPNHVRNFIALAQAGYYEGLMFDRIVHQESEAEDGAKVRIDLVKAGCPIGTGEEGVGHLGYFLKPEISAELKHAEGTVGFVREASPASACCRFYVTLGPAPALDGEFTVIGKVAKGLDVVKRIAAAPVQDERTYPERERPRDPVALKKVTIAPAP